jgi:hypothetical protein
MTKHKIKDYSVIPIPREGDPTKYFVEERRALLLKLILEAGHPALISQPECAKMFGVSQQMISKDIEAIKESIVTSIGNDSEFITEMIYKKTLKDLMNTKSSKDKFLATKVLESWNNWLFDSGRKDRAASKVELKSMGVEFHVHTTGAINEYPNFNKKRDPTGEQETS